MVALPIAGLLVAGVAGMYYQMVTTRSFVDGQLAASAEVQASGAWFSQDTVQAQVVKDGNYGDDDTLLIEAPQDAAIPGPRCFAWSGPTGTMMR
jgi:hypothetical protein